MSANGDLEPDQLIVRETRRWSSNLARRLRDLIHAWAGVKVLGWIVAAALVIWAGVASSLELGFVIGVAILLVVAAAYLIGARRLLRDERARRRWTQISALRVEQQLIRARQQNVVTALALSGHRDPGHLNQDVRAALVALRRRGAGGEPEPERTRQERIDKLLAAKAELEAEQAACEARIQSLADPNDAAAAAAATETAEQAARSRAAARAADQAARVRRRRGMSATTNARGMDMAIEFKPDGSRAVRQVTPEPTPEEIADVRRAGVPEVPGGLRPANGRRLAHPDQSG